MFLVPMEWEGAWRFRKTTEEIDNSLRQAIGIIPKWRVGRPPALLCVFIRGIRVILVRIGSDNQVRIRRSQ